VRYWLNQKSQFFYALPTFDTTMQMVCGQLSTCVCVVSYQGKFQLRGPVLMALRNRELHARNDDNDDAKVIPTGISAMSWYCQKPKTWSYKVAMTA